MGQLQSSNTTRVSEEVPANFRLIHLFDIVVLILNLVVLTLWVKTDDFPFVIAISKYLGYNGANAEALRGVVLADHPWSCSSLR
jgi:hypothetical protein